MSNAAPQTASPQMPDGATLLVVDDDPLVRRALRRMIEVDGISVVEAGDGEHALHVIAQDEAQLLDAVLTDLAMPVVAMSAFAQLSPNVLPVPFLQKPFDQEELVGTVAPLILKSRAMRQQARQSRADAAESHSLAARQHTVAGEQVARSRDLMVALMEVRSRMALQRKQSEIGRSGVPARVEP